MTQLRRRHRPTAEPTDLNRRLMVLAKQQIRVPGVRVVDDLVGRKFRPEVPNVLWVADITSPRTSEGWLTATRIASPDRCDGRAPALAGGAAPPSVERRRPRDVSRANPFRRPISRADGASTRSGIQRRSASCLELSRTTRAIGSPRGHSSPTTARLTAQPLNRSTAHAIVCRALHIHHLRPRPCRPQTNGKAERFIRGLFGGWAYGAIYRNSQERNAALAGWLDFYNRRRPHGALSPQPSALSPQPSALSPQPSALSPQPSALSPQPSALSPQPSALSPQPSALSPQPSALSPQPSALSPQPSALSPQPSALSPQPLATPRSPQRAEQPLRVLQLAIRWHSLLHRNQRKLHFFEESSGNSAKTLPPSAYTLSPATSWLLFSILPNPSNACTISSLCPVGIATRTAPLIGSSSSKPHVLVSLKGISAIAPSDPLRVATSVMPAPFVTDTVIKLVWAPGEN